jgi:hypothetical protein
MNGLDSQTCLECHSILSNATIPATFAVGGVGGVSDNAIPGVIDPDINDSLINGFAAIQGRFINPPFSFGSGGVELLGKEMTADLQALKAEAVNNPGTVVNLITKGVSFGSISFDGSVFYTSNIKGIDDGDGVVNELTVDELSVLHIFQVALERPVKTAQNNHTRNGRESRDTHRCYPHARRRSTGGERRLRYPF